MVPWLVYDWHEKTHLIVYVIFYIMISLTIPALNNLFSQVHDVTEIQNGLLGKIIFTIAAIGITGPLLFFMYNNFVSRGNSKKLVIKLEDQKKELLKKEAELNLSIRRIRESQEQEKERVWESTGLTIFSNLLRNEYESVDDVAQGVITQLVKYLDVNQGGVFLLNDTDKDNLYLELRGCFAFERSRFINKKIDVGEGMLGQCYLEKETMCINPIPKNYLKITSGLGELAPTVLLIVPIKSGQKVLGIIELAAFSELPQHKISFVEKLCESVATALLSIQANIAIRKLLASSQQLTADMKNREESMSKNMEELMLRESVYRNKIDELSSTNSA
jgi:transcriptional regulator with GAF, ATPase, and Fis domain